MLKLRQPCRALLIGSAATRVWFSDFRAAPDFDCYVLPEFVDEFLAANPDFEIRRRTARKLVGILGEQKIDLTTDKEGSWIGHIMKANESSPIMPLWGFDITLAKPTTLRLIKEVLSCWRIHWRKHAWDYMYLCGRVGESYTDDEVKAIEIGMATFERFYPDPGVPIRPIPIRTFNELWEDVRLADLESRVYIKDNIHRLLGYTCESNNKQ